MKDNIILHFLKKVSLIIMIDEAVEIYLRMLDLNFDRIISRLDTFFLPFLKKDQVLAVCNEARSLIGNDPVLMHINSPCYIVGDIHGNLIDLIRILKKIKYNGSTNILFLGDYIDRGEFSFETMMLLFVLKIKYPQKVFFLRGNHEFSSEITISSKLPDEISKQYDEKDLIYQQILENFAVLPLAAIIDSKVFCVHGGIGPQVMDIQVINNIQRPVYNCDSYILKSLLWSDPGENVGYFKDSPRNIGYTFGKHSCKEFLRNNNLERIVRAHEFKIEGFSSCFDGLVTTVFSSSNYDDSKNKASAAFYSNDKLDIIELESVATIKRAFTEQKEKLIKTTRSNSFIEERDSKPPRNPSLSPSNSSKTISRIKQTSAPVSSPRLVLCGNKNFPKH